jgi:hypothetical protein
MKQILLLLAVIVFLFVSFEVLLRVNYYVLLAFNKAENKDVSVYKEKRKYKLMLVETFVNANKYVQSKSIQLVK